MDVVDIPGPDLSGAVPAVLAVAHRAALLAGQVRGGAAVLRAAGGPGGDGGWRGAAADAERVRRHELGRRLDGCADDLESLAAAAVVHARTAQDRADDVHRLLREAGRLLGAAADVVR